MSYTDRYDDIAKSEQTMRAIHYCQQAIVATAELLGLPAPDSVRVSGGEGVVGWNKEFVDVYLDPQEEGRQRVVICCSISRAFGGDVPPAPGDSIEMEFARGMLALNRRAPQTPFPDWKPSFKDLLPRLIGVNSSSRIDARTRLQLLALLVEETK